MHGLAVFSAFFVSQAGASDEAASGFVGMVEGWEKSPIGLTGVDRVVIKRVVSEACGSGLLKCLAMSEGGLSELIN